jgi:hypothetical protein
MRTSVREGNSGTEGERIRAKARGSFAFVRTRAGRASWAVAGLAASRAAAPRFRAGPGPLAIWGCRQPSLFLRHFLNSFLRETCKINMKFCTSPKIVKQTLLGS